MPTSLSVIESARDEISTPMQSASSGIPADWSSQSRTGRKAVAAGDFSAAEVFLFSALRATAEFRSSDVRIDASLGNLIRLAARYQENGHDDQSNRLLLEIKSAAAEQQITQRRVDVQQARYADSTCGDFL
jgi:hypothetical protein